MSEKGSAKVEDVGCVRVGVDVEVEIFDSAPRLPSAPGEVLVGFGARIDIRVRAEINLTTRSFGDGSEEDNIGRDDVRLRVEEALERSRLVYG